MEYFLHWPWWLGALVLGSLTIGSYFGLARPLGVSRHWGWLLRGPRREEALLNDPSALQAALLEATREEFGGDCGLESPEEPRDGGGTANRPPKKVQSESFEGSILFLLMLVVGGFLGALLRGDLQWRAHLGESFNSSFGSGVGSWLILFLGGIFIGFGVRLAGGCPSGHGLSGCSRLSVSSFIAVASFFVGGIAVSLLLKGLS